MLLICYLLVTLFYLSSTFAGVLRIIRLFQHSPKFNADSVTHILLEQELEAFSFFNWLFYHPAIQPDSAIIAHELVHIRQKHSLDLLFFDLVCAISWFNPVLYIMRRDMKLNHEYLADEQASREGNITPGIILLQSGKLILVQCTSTVYNAIERTKIICIHR